MTLGGSTTFRGNDRFSVRRELGRGGMGVVYEAFDRERGESVALKTLHGEAPSTLYLFKREFRALSDVVHRNLVSLYELFADGDTWFFTMELVDGVDFLTYVGVGREEVVGSEAGYVQKDVDVARLREAVGQLVQGIVALHRAGKIHRDIKPSNVLVTPQGRVVILDFGIVAETKTSAAPETVEEGIWGSVAYMSPEQAAGHTSGPSSDWYAVGTLLYQALTGELPFSGDPMRVMMAKQSDEAGNPSDIVPELPPDLVRACRHMIRRHPGDRPSERQVIDMFQVSRFEGVVDRHSVSGAHPALVGRRAELEEMENALTAITTPATGVMLVQGRSGMGKTTLLRHFTDELATSERALVFRGRCFVRESVPYKAFDDAIDQLSRFLKGLAADEVERLVPRESAALIRVFPVLARVDAFARHTEESLRKCPRCARIVEADASFCSSCGEHVEEAGRIDRRALRRRAFEALHELLARLAHRRPLVIQIDDAQWADQDSIELLDHLVEAADPIPLLFLVSFRSEEIERSAFLSRLVAEVGRPHRWAVTLGPLSLGEAAEFVESNLDREGSGQSEVAETLARESEGNPFLLDQMVQATRESSGQEISAVNLDEMLATRVRQMPTGASELIEVLAVAAQPIPAEIAYRAAGLEGDERPLVSMLRMAHLVRASGFADRIEPYHDRIRETHLRGLEADALQGIHARLAESLEKHAMADPQTLYQHCLGAGWDDRALEHAIKAAEGARAALAFERSAIFFQHAIDLAGPRDPRTAGFHVGLGDAQASAGWGGKAAESYLRAAGSSDRKTELELKRRAGEQLLISGRQHEGLDVLREVLQSVGLRMPSTPRRALVALLFRRLVIRFRGLGFRETRAEEVPPDQLTRIDVCWAVAEGQGLIDNIQGAAFNALHLLLALRTGEPNRVARALAIEAGYTASAVSTDQAAELLTQAEQLAERLEAPSVLGLCALQRAIVAYYRCEFRRSNELVAEAETILSGHLSFAAWHLGAARIYHIHILSELGEVDEITRLSREFLRDATDRGNLFSTVVFRTGWSIWMWLAVDDADGARKALRGALQDCPKGIFNIPYFECVLAQSLVDLYTGDVPDAYYRVMEVWPRIKASMLLRVKTIRVHTYHLRARCAIATAAAGHDRERLLKQAEGDAHLLEREPSPGRAAMGTLIRTLVAAQRHDQAGATALMEKAVDAFATSDMGLWRAVAERGLGRLLGDPRGAAMISSADAWMTGQGIAVPDRAAEMLAPGLGALGGRSGLHDDP